MQFKPVLLKGQLYSVDTGQEMINDRGGMELDGMRFHHGTQSSAQFKTYYCLFLESFI